MVDFFKNDPNLAATRKLLDAINASTDDYLFVYDMKQDTMWFFGEVDKNFNIREKGEETNTLSQFLSVVYPADRPSLEKEYTDLANGIRNEQDINFRLVKKDGNVVWINCRGSVVRDNDDAATFIGRVSEGALRHLYNPLTGLWNKNKLREDLEKKLRESDSSLMLIDIDHLAAINLSHGRAFGDKLLKEVGGLLESHKMVEKCYHIDHNNFAAIINSKDEDEINEIYCFINEKMKLTCTFTAGAVPIDSEIFLDASQLLDSVNVTFKKAKQKSKDRVEFFSSEEIDLRVESLELLEELKESVRNNFEGFELYYQPQVKGGSYELYGVEALLRYDSKTRGRIFPNVFIPLLEQSRLIEKVGLWVLKTALLQCKEWRKTIPELCVSVNFSTVQFEDAEISEKVINILKESGMPGDSLTVEITESIQFHKNDNFDTHIRVLREVGVGIAIDDFGTGYSNLGYLKQINVDEIKVDRSFVSGIEKNTYNYRLINNVIEFAKTNSIRICCEGVETSDELVTLESMRPDKIQGFLFDKPSAAADIEKKYINNSSDEYRGRLSFIEEIYRYKEKIGVIHFDKRDILRENNIGLWIIRIDENKSYFEMHADETMERLLGINFKYTPGECYEYWHGRIKPEFVKNVEKSVNAMIDEDKNVQLKYLWDHPELGEVTVRCSGRRVQDADGMVVVEGYHTILTDAE